MGVLRSAALLALSSPLLWATGAQAQLDLDAFGSLLVVPFFANPGQETYVSITNGTSSALVLQIVFVFPDWGEMDISCHVTGRETTLLQIEPVPASPLSRVSFECTDPATGLPLPFVDTLDGSEGFLVITAEDPASGATDNSVGLFASSVIVDYAQGWAVSLPAWNFEGGSGAGDGDRDYRFDALEYEAPAAELAANFRAPVAGGVETELILVPIDGTVGLVGGPEARLEVTYYNDDELPTSRLYTFSCFVVVPLAGIDPGFEKTLLGSDVGHLRLLPVGEAQTNTFHDGLFDGGIGADGLRKTSVVGWILETGGGQPAAGRKLYQSIDRAIPLTGDTPVFSGPPWRQQGGDRCAETSAP